MTSFRHTDLFSTYSIVARDAATGQLGVAVQTHQMGVGRLVPWLLPGVGAVATQSLVNISFGPMGLAMLRQGVPAPRVVDALVASDEGAARRQVAVIDGSGRAGAWTGGGCIAHAGHQLGEGYSVQANMMTNTTVIAAMAAAYEKTSGDLAAKMLAALEAAESEGGDIRGTQSAALVVVPGEKDRPEWTTDYDLRVDEHAAPLVELARLVRLRRAQQTDAAGYTALEAGKHEEALAAWAAARAAAPELEELGFWQAITLADRYDDVNSAAAILRPVMEKDTRRAHWIDLIQRLTTCGLIERTGAGEALIAAL